MNARGQYGKIIGSVPGRQGQTYVGASLVHTLELKQRYSNVNTAAATALLNTLSNDGVASSVGTNRWEIALKDGAWVLFTWYPDYSALEVTITDREVRRVGDVDPVRRRYEAILRKITPPLTSFGATVVGGAIYAAGSTAPRAVQLGQGSFIPHTPTEVDAELQQLHGEMMGFGQEAIVLLDKTSFAYGDENKRLMDELLDIERFYESIRPLVQERDRLQKEVHRLSSLSRNYPGVIKELFDAQLALNGAQAKIDKVKSPTEREALVRRRLELQRQRGTIEKSVRREVPLARWYETVWTPFFDAWQEYYEQKTDVPAQTWPLSGTWDQIQDYRKQFIALRNKAPFKAQGPTPLDPTARTDPSATRGLRDIWGGAGDVFGVLKWGLIGALGIGAVVALASVVSNVRKGKDPAEKYVGMIGGRRSRSARALPGRREQLALPPGLPEDA